MTLIKTHAWRKIAAVLFLTIFQGLSTPSAEAGWKYWQSNASSKASLTLKPTRESAYSLGNQGPAGVGQALELVFKRFGRVGAQPVLLLPGIASNDRLWDAAVPENSFARYLHARGYDVWVGNYRNSGTEGFRSENPGLPYHWTVEDLAIYDLPMMIEKVRVSTGRRPFIVAHSLSAWVLEGYLAGMHYGVDGEVRTDANLGRLRQVGLKGMISVAGIFNVWWPNSIRNVFVSPVLSWNAFYQSNYGLEAFAHSGDLFYEIAYQTPTLPLSWVGDLLRLPLADVPLVGSWLAKAYGQFQEQVIGSPALAMFFYPGNVDTEVVRTHGLDGLEEFGPRLIEQLGNAVVHRETTAFYHRNRPKDVYAYASVRKSLRLPQLFIAGEKDRLANARMIERDGFRASGSKDKAWISSEAGHLDVIVGENAERAVLEPLVDWMRKRQ